MSPGADYTIIAPFHEQEVGPPRGGRMLSDLKLVSDENGAEGVVRLLCDFGPN